MFSLQCSYILGPCTVSHHPVSQIKNSCSDPRGEDMMSLISNFLWSSIWTISDSLELQVIIHSSSGDKNSILLSWVIWMTIYYFHPEDNWFMLSLNIPFLQLQNKFIGCTYIVTNSTTLFLPWWDKAK